MPRLSNSGNDLRSVVAIRQSYLWMDEFPEVNCFPSEVKENYRKKWKL